MIKLNHTNNLFMPSRNKGFEHFVGRIVSNLNKENCILYVYDARTVLPKTLARMPKRPVQKKK